MRKVKPAKKKRVDQSQKRNREIYAIPLEGRPRCRQVPGPVKAVATIQLGEEAVLTAKPHTGGGGENRGLT